jgi:DNA-binding NarL/FixJ family response regulator
MSEIRRDAQAHTKPDFVLVSLALPDLGAVEILRQIHAASPASKIIAQTAQCSEFLLHQIGTHEYDALLHDTEENLSTLGQAINRARHGMRTISSRVAQCQTALRTDPDAFPKLLSNREQEVLVCIAHSMSDQETAQQLGLSRLTAQTHRRNIMHKLGIGRTPKLIRWCIDKGFNSVPPPAPAKSRLSA